MSEPTYSSPADEAFFGAVGRLAVSWSLMEFGLDCIISIFYYDLSGHEIESEIPWALQRKIKFIRKCFGKLITVDSLKTQALAVMDEVQAASEMRHDIFHGFTIEHAEGASEAVMARMLRGQPRYAHKKYTVTTQQILQSAIDANQLATRTLAVATLLQEAVRIASEELKKTDGELPR